MAGTVAARSAGRRLDAFEELLDRLEEAVGRLQVRRVAAAVEEHPLAVADALVDEPHDVRADLVELARDQQQRDVDLAEAVDDRPLAQRADDRELARPVHGAVDGRVGLHLVEAAHERVRPRVEAAHVADVELLDRGRVLGVVGRPRLLVAEDRRLHVRVERVEQRDRAARERVRVGGRVGRHDRHQARRGGERVVHREHPAPRLAEDVVAPGDPEVVDERGQLVLEELRRPERRIGVGQVVAASVAELVVEHARAPGAVQLGDRLDVVVRRPRPAVADHERRAQPVRVEVADDPVPGPVAVALEVALHGRGTYLSASAARARSVTPAGSNGARRHVATSPSTSSSSHHAPARACAPIAVQKSPRAGNGAPTAPGFSSHVPPASSSCSPGTTARRSAPPSGRARQAAGSWVWPTSPTAERWRRRHSPAFAAVTYSWTGWRGLPCQHWTPARRAAGRRPRSHAKASASSASMATASRSWLPISATRQYERTSATTRAASGPVPSMSPSDHSSSTSASTAARRTASRASALPWTSAKTAALTRRPRRRASRRARG